MAKLVPKTKPSEELDFMPRVLGAAEAASAVKARDIVAYDVRGITLIADSFVVCTVDSEPQMRAVKNRVEATLRDIGHKALHTEGQQSSGWIVLDYGAVIVHIFKKDARAYYDLDALWADAPKFELDLD